MMGKTHYAMGMAVAVAAMQPKDVKECVIALSAGALGGVFADIDIVKNDYKHDALIGQLLAYGTVGVAFVLDFFMNLGILPAIIDGMQERTLIGLGMYFIVAIVGFASKHRTFTHSFLALGLSLIAVTLIYRPFGMPYAIGYLSHLGLDLLNKKKVPLLFPKSGGICLGWCYASKSANTVFMIVSFIAIPVLIAVNMGLNSI